MSTGRSPMAIALVVCACLLPHSTSRSSNLPAIRFQMNPSLLLLRGGYSGDPYDLREQATGASFLANLIRKGELSLPNVNISSLAAEPEADHLIAGSDSDKDDDAPQTPEGRKAPEVSLVQGAVPEQKDDTRHVKSKDAYGQRDEKERDPRDSGWRARRKIPLYRDEEHGRRFWDKVFDDLRENHSEAELDNCIELFTLCGKVKAVFVGGTPETEGVFCTGCFRLQQDMSEGTAYVLMDSRKSVVSAIQNLNGHEVEGRRLVVGAASRRRLEELGRENIEDIPSQNEDDERTRNVRRHLAGKPTPVGKKIIASKILRYSTISEK
eukprot:753020-Hanusia_phi.AAC.3